MKQRITRMNHVTSKQLYKRRTGWVVATAAAGAILGVSGVSVAHADTVTAKSSSSVSSVTKQQNSTQSKEVVLKQNAVQQNVQRSASQPAAGSATTANQPAAKQSASQPAQATTQATTTVSRSDAQRALNDAALKLAQTKQAAQQSALQLRALQTNFAVQSGNTNSTTQKQGAQPDGSYVTNSGSVIPAGYNWSGLTQTAIQSNQNAIKQLVGSVPAVPEPSDANGGNYYIAQYVDANGKTVGAAKIVNVNLGDSYQQMMASQYLNDNEIMENCPKGYKVAGAYNIGDSSTNSIEGTTVDVVPNMTIQSEDFNADGKVDTILVMPENAVGDTVDNYTKVSAGKYYGDANTPANEVLDAIGNPNFGKSTQPATNQPSGSTTPATTTPSGSTSTTGNNQPTNSSSSTNQSNGGTPSTDQNQPTNSGSTKPSTSTPDGLTPAGSDQIDTAKNPSGSTNSGNPTQPSDTTKPATTTPSGSTTKPATTTPTSGSTVTKPATTAPSGSTTTKPTTSTSASGSTATKPSTPASGSTANKPATNTPTKPSVATKPNTATKPSATPSVKPAASQSTPSGATPSAKPAASQASATPQPSAAHPVATDVVFPPLFKETVSVAQARSTAARHATPAVHATAVSSTTNQENTALRRSHKRTLPDTGNASGAGLIGLGIGAILTALGFARPARKH
ncbi:hypothetical protein ACLHIM_00025 [Ligilactobacillus sp. LYQ112]|uniref:hypothetical protein n=1 Tax=Ligilactobacillus sp. LYQ112 TaxID=3391060 RepID=UPI0039834472